MQNTTAVILYRLLYIGCSSFEPVSSHIGCPSNIEDMDNTAVYCQQGIARFELMQEQMEHKLKPVQEIPHRLIVVV